MKKIIAFAVAAAAWGASSSAHAEPGTHDGFQFRGAIGGGFVSDSESLSGSNQSDTISGGAVGFELYAGGFVVPGVSIGGFLGGLSAPGPSVSINGQTLSGNSNATLTPVWFGPYVDWYPDAQGGFHLSLAPELTRVSVSDGQGNSQDSNIGWGLGVGIGYDFWVTRSFSIGVLGRLNYQNDSFTSSSGANFTESIVTPAVLVTFNYH
jgi:hypothetical protein